MKLLSKFLLLCLFATGCVVLFSGEAKAQTTVAGTASASPTSPRIICNTGAPVDFAAYVASPSLNVNTGVVSYNIGVGWATCGFNPDVTRAYAIYANPELCPVSGYYGSGPSGAVTDCTKYIGSPPYVGAGNGLACPAVPGTNGACIAPGTNSDIVAQQGPISGFAGYRGRVFNMSYVIPNWSTVKNSSGSRTVASNMCQFYKTGANFGTQISDSRCVNLSITVNWSFTAAADNGSCDAVMQDGSIVAPGESKVVDYTVRNTGGSDWGLDSPTDRHRLRNRDSPIWGVPTDNEIEGSGVQNTGFGRILFIGGVTSWSRSLQIPPDTPDGTYTFNWQIFGKGNAASTAVYIGVACPLVVTVENPITKPYFKAYNSDVVVGRGFDLDGSGTCSSDPAGIKADVRSVGGGRWAGSGAEFAARASDIIDGFVSRDRQTSDSPTALTFGNMGPSRITTFSGEPGKDAGAYSGCIPDYWNELAKPGFTELTAGVSNGIWNGTIPSGGGYFWYGDDLTINGNVTLPNWTDIEDIPRFYLVVYGNINIAPGVDNVDGVIIAQPRADGQGGTINTCAAPSTQWNECKNKLTFNGAVVAGEIKLNRLNGDVSDAGFDEDHEGNDNIAEVFNFLPEIYLAQLEDQLEIPVAGPRKYDNIIGLPPVL